MPPNNRLLVTGRKLLGHSLGTLSNRGRGQPSAAGPHQKRQPLGGPRRALLHYSLGHAVLPLLLALPACSISDHLPQEDQSIPADLALPPFDLTHNDCSGSGFYVCPLICPGQCFSSFACVNTQWVCNCFPPPPCACEGPGPAGAGVECQVDCSCSPGAGIRQASRCLHDGFGGLDWPQGYCTSPCRPNRTDPLTGTNSDCLGTEAACVDSFGDPICLATCATSDECRPYYSCRRVGDAGIAVCIPGSAADAGAPRG